MSPIKKIALDARDLEHPRPLELSMKALQELDQESYFHMIHRKNPIPLIDLASEQNFQVLNREDSEGNWHILIAKNKDIDLQSLLP